jgi:hypothetical protein
MLRNRCKCASAPKCSLNLTRNRVVIYDFYTFKKYSKKEDMPNNEICKVQTRILKILIAADGVSV